MYIIVEIKAGIWNCSGDRRIHKRPFGLTNLQYLCGTISWEPKQGRSHAAAYVPPDWANILNNSSSRDEAGRGGGRKPGTMAAARRKHLRGYDSLEGERCLPTCLQGCQLRDSHKHMGADAHVKMSMPKHINGGKECLKTDLVNATKLWLMLLLLPVMANVVIHMLLCAVTLLSLVCSFN